MIFMERRQHARRSRRRVSEGLVMRTVLLGAAVAASVLFVAPASAAEGPPAGAFSILFENDIFFNTDRHYTNGTALAYTTAPQDTPDWAVDLAHDMPFFEHNSDVRMSYMLAQDIFTPQNTALTNPDPLDRPYAGYLYLGFGLLGVSDTHLDQIQLQLGMIGPASLAQDAQNWVHSIISNRLAQGWHFQLRDEPGVEVIYERSFKIIPPQSWLGLFFDLEPHAGIAVGNVYDYVNAGAMARAGINLPDDFGPMRLEPSLPGSGFFEPNGEVSAYVFAGVDGRAVGRNIFLDGNSFETSRSVDKDTFVGDLQIGAVVAIDDVRLSFTHVFRTKEFRTQTSADQFGAVNLTFRL
jgi:hypothetical protein